MADNMHPEMFPFKGYMTYVYKCAFLPAGKISELPRADQFCVCSISSHSTANRTTAFVIKFKAQDKPALR